MIIRDTIAFFGILLRAASWRELYRATTEGRLATADPYAFVRHPQYAGLFIAIFDEGVGGRRVGTGRSVDEALHRPHWQSRSEEECLAYAAYAASPAPVPGFC